MATLIFEVNKTLHNQGKIKYSISQNNKEAAYIIYQYGILSLYFLDEVFTGKSLKNLYAIVADHYNRDADVRIIENFVKKFHIINIDTFTKKPRQSEIDKWGYRDSGYVAEKTRTNLIKVLSYLKERKLDSGVQGVKINRMQLEVDFNTFGIKKAVMGHSTIGDKLHPIFENYSFVEL